MSSSAAPTGRIGSLATALALAGLLTLAAAGCGRYGPPMRAEATPPAAAAAPEAPPAAPTPDDDEDQESQP